MSLFSNLITFEEILKINLTLIKNILNYDLYENED